MGGNCQNATLNMNIRLRPIFLLAWLSCLLASLAVAPRKKELGGLFDDVGSVERETCGFNE